MWETQVRSLGQEDPLEKEMTTHCNILAWRIPWTEEPGGLQSTGSQRVRHDWATILSFFLLFLSFVFLGFPVGASGKEPACQCKRKKRHGFDPWVGKIPRAWQPTLVFLPGESQGQRSLAGYSQWGCRVRLDWAIGTLSFSYKLVFFSYSAMTKRNRLKSSNIIVNLNRSLFGFCPFDSNILTFWY